MSNDTAREQTGSLLTASVLSGLFTGAAVMLTLSVAGLLLMEASVFAILSGLTTGAFVYRERYLTLSSNRFRYELNLEVDRLEKRIQNYYDNSLICLAYFDAGTLLIEKVSPGLLLLLRIPPEMNVRGKSVAELLRVTSASIEAIVLEARNKADLSQSHRLMAEDSQGNQLPVEITAEYFKKTHMVEAAFFVSSLRGGYNSDESDTDQKDLDRFRRGMYRRETRILELKEEINRILKQTGQAPHYNSDPKTKDTSFRVEKLSNSEQAK